MAPTFSIWLKCWLQQILGQSKPCYIVFLGKEHYPLLSTHVTQEKSLFFYWDIMCQRKRILSRLYLSAHHISHNCIFYTIGPSNFTLCRSIYSSHDVEDTGHCFCVTPKSKVKYICILLLNLWM